MSEKLLASHSATELSKMIRENQIDRVDLVHEPIDTVNANNGQLKLLQVYGRNAL